MSLLAAVTFIAALSSTSQPYRQVEVCFVLDTTGSMSNLIETAKEKIWFIANEIANAPTQPDVRFCLLGFRDRGDDYVTRHFDLTADLDAIHKELLAFEANGGGDTPEAVYQALFEVVEYTSWSDADEVLKLVFLVGDAPPHEDYDEPQFGEISARAHGRGVILNPVLVGHDTDTSRHWRQMAEQSGTRSLQVDNSAGQGTIETPMDQDLAVLGPRLERLIIPYGSDEAQLAHDALLERSEEFSDATASDRLSYMASSDRWAEKVDLLAAIDRNEVSLESVNQAWLPASVRSMSHDELRTHLQSIRVERDALRRLIKSLVEQRRAYIQQRRAGDGFEAKVAGVIVEHLGEG